MRQVKLLIEYDGTGYQGWQSQRSGLTIQDIVRRTISGITGEQVKLVGASRTDSGVHALGQVAAFATRSGLPVDRIMRALNAKLPRDIRIRSAHEIERSFSPRYGALRKSYFYIISRAPHESAFIHRYVWDITMRLDLHAMREAAAQILGEHDFSCFRASGCGSKNPVRTVYSIDITRHRKMSFMTSRIQGDFIKISIEANAFLRHMARNIVGTIVEIGRGRLTPVMMGKILKSRDRKLSGPTAPARGLFLEKITY